MNMIADAMGGLGAVLLPVAAALLFEELTFGGLVRLLVVPRRNTGRPAQAKPECHRANLPKRYNPRSKSCAERRGP
jgi:hypothetical protein